MLMTAQHFEKRERYYDLPDRSTKHHLWSNITEREKEEGRGERGGQRDRGRGKKEGKRVKEEGKKEEKRGGRQRGKKEGKKLN